MSLFIRTEKGHSDLSGQRCGFPTIIRLLNIKATGFMYPCNIFYQNRTWFISFATGAYK